MEPDYDITLNSSDGESSDATKSHFLNSLGLGERNGEPGALQGGRQKVEDEGVVLSSLPDDLGFSMIPSEPARGLSLSFSVTRGTDRGTPTAISLPSDEEPEPEPEAAISETSLPEENVAPENETTAPVSGDPEAILHLACPECDGALVLKRRHLGVEGACVWCHTAIVAAESGRDGAVRIFPILGVRVPAPADAKPTEVAVPDATAASGSVTAPAPSMEEPSSSNQPEPAVASLPEPPEASDENVASIPGESEQPIPSGFVPSSAEPAGDFMTGFSPEGSPSVFETECAPVEDAFITNDPPDLDSLYETGGFVAPLASAPASPETAPVVAKEIPSSDFEAPAPIPAGFGSFLQSAQPLTESEPSAGFAGPTPWGPPVRPAVTAPTAPKSTVPAVPEPDDAPPSALPDGFIPSMPAPAPSPTPTWESAFGSPSVAATSPGPASEANDTFAAAFGSPFGTGSADTKKESSPFAGFPVEKPLSSPLPEPAQDPQAGFLSSANAFSTGSSAWSESAPSGGGLFAGLGHPGQLPWGTTPAAPADEAPSTLSDSTPEPGFATEPEAAFASGPVGSVNPFGEVPAPAGVSPFPSLAQVTTPLPAAPAFPVAATPLLPPSMPSASVTPTETAVPTVAATPGVTPGTPNEPTSQVTSLPLGAKPKPKVRKGFIVLMVVILGFASGAALASFVLPVERYVEAARSFMEAKFAPKPAVPVMPQLNDLPAGPVITPGAPSPSDLQP